MVVTEIAFVTLGDLFLQIVPFRSLALFQFTCLGVQSFDFAFNGRALFIELLVGVTQLRFGIQFDVVTILISSKHILIRSFADAV